MRKGRDGGRKAPPPPTPGGNGAAARPDRDRGGGREHAPPSRALPSPPSPPEGEGWVLLGEFGRAHGLKGEVRLKSFTGDPAAIAAYGPLRTDRGPLLTLAKVRPAPGGVPDLLIAVVQGVASREAAEALNRTRLWIERDRLPPPEDEDEFLLADLIGLAVEKPDGTPLGTVVAVPNFGGGDLLEIAPQGGGPTALLPFTKAFVPVVEIANRCVVADAPEDLFAPARPEPDSPDEDPDASAERP